MLNDNGAPQMIYIDKENVDFYKTSKILGTDNNKIKHHEQFLISLALGFKSGIKKEVKNPDPSGFTRPSYLSKKQKALICAIAISHHKDVNDIGSVPEIYKLAEEYANGGIQIIKDLEKDTSHDNYLSGFERLIDKEIKKIEESEKE